MLGALGVSGDESPTKADGYCILDDCALDVSSGGATRTAKYALSTSQASGDIAVVFLPLGVSRLFVTREDVAESARDAGLRLLAVDRPGVGGTAPATQKSAEAREPYRARRDVDVETAVIREKLETAAELEQKGKDWWRYSRTVRRRLWTHSRDVAQVLKSLGIDGVHAKARVVGVCAGSPYALHFARCFPELVDRTHLTLVTPWVSPECPHSWSVARLASNRWFGGRSFVGYLLGSLQLGVTIPLLRSLEPHEALDLLEKKLTDAEREEVRLQRLAQHVAKEDASFSDEEALGLKALGHLRDNADAHNVAALTDDVRVCLSTLDEIDVAPESLGFERATVFAADCDDLVKPDAVEWLAAKLPNSRLVVFGRSSHSGVQMLRRREWLRAAATHGDADRGATLAPAVES